MCEVTTFFKIILRSCRVHGKGSNIDHHNCMQNEVITSPVITIPTCFELMIPDCTSSSITGTSFCFDGDLLNVLPSALSSIWFLVWYLPIMERDIPRNWNATWEKSYKSHSNYQNVLTFGVVWHTGKVLACGAVGPQFKPQQDQGIL